MTQTLVLVSINLLTKFEMSSYTYSNVMTETPEFKEFSSS